MDASSVVVVPVKPPTVGKSRLQGLTDDERRGLAEAFAVDTVGACLRATTVARVLVVTDDAHLASRMQVLGCEALPDGAAGDLNAALAQAVAETSRRWPGLRPVALCADLPALRPDDLDAALASARSVAPDGASFVADAAGTGTTLYAAPVGAFDPRFGNGSRHAHLESGATELDGPLASLRQDVDDLDDLRAALGLGVGPATSVLATHLRL